MIGLAEALFDNAAEWPDELQFRRGELLRVLDENPGAGLADGWWLCADQHGHRGIAPANRLRLIRRFGTGLGNRVVTPRRYGDLFMYATDFFDSDDLFPSMLPPPSMMRTGHSSSYDVPSVSQRHFSGSPVHDAEHPFVYSRRLDSTYDRPSQRLAAVIQQPTTNRTESRVFNVPIKIEGRQERSLSTPARASPVRMVENGGHSTLKQQSAEPSPLATVPGLNGGIHAKTGNYDLLPSSMQTTVQPKASPVDSVDGSSSAPTKSLYRQLAEGLYDKLGPVDKDNSSTGTTSSLSITPDRSSFTDSNRSSLSNHETYDVPPRPLNNGTTTVLEPVIEKPPPPLPLQTDDATKAGDRNSLGSVLLNVLGDLELYDSPKAAGNGLHNGSKTLDVVAKAAKPGDPLSTHLSSSNPALYDSLSSATANHNIASTSAVKNVPPEPPVRKQSKQVTFSASAPNTPSRTFAMNGSILKAPPVSDVKDGDAGSDRLSVSSVDSKDSDYQALFDAKDVRLSTSAAMDNLARLQQTLHASVTKMGQFVTKHWRKRTTLEANLFELRMTCKLVINALNEFVDFVSGAFVNSTKLAEQQAKMTRKLAHLIRPLRESQRMLQQAHAMLEAKSWQLSYLVRESGGNGNDALDQFVAIAKTMPEDARQAASFIQGNAPLLFGAAYEKALAKLQERPLPAPPQALPVQNGLSNSNFGAQDSHSNGGSDQERSLFDDYDFIEGHTPSISEPELPKPKENGAMTNGGTDQAAGLPIDLTAEDRQIFSFYATQVNAHMECLTSAIDRFLTSVEQNKAPKVFVGESKFVILAAHKLVYMADSIAQCIKNEKVAARLKETSDALCEVLKYTVASTKQAALQYPSIPSIQAMVDSMVTISHAAHRLKLLIQNAAAM